jgi:hypothetical protein
LLSEESVFAVRVGADVDVAAARRSIPTGDVLKNANRFSTIPRS